MAECTGYLALLDSDDKEVVRESAFRAGEDHCVEAVPRLARLLTTNHLGIQEAVDSSLRKIGGKETVQAVLPLLRSDDAPVRNLSMDILREVGSQDMNSLIDLISDPDPDIRIFIADILGSTGSLLAVEPLCEALLRDPEVNVRYQAAVSLGDLGMPEAAPCLNKAINDEEWVQYSVIEALTKIGHSSSVDALVKALDAASDLVASMIIDSLGELGNVKAVTMLLKRMPDAPTALRNKIVKAVVKILGGRSLTLLSDDERERFRQYLLVALEDEDEDIQDAAIQGLAHVGGEQASRAILGIAAGLDGDRDQDRLRTIVDCLSGIGLTDALQDALHGEDPGAAGVAVQTLARIAPEQCGCDLHDVCDVLMKAFWKTPLPIQRQIISVAAERADESAKDFFIRILEEHDDGTVLKSVVYLLGEKLRLPEVVDDIFPLLSHQYDDVKEAALNACIAIGGEAVTTRFREMFAGQDPIERFMATYALGKLGAEENFEYFKEAVEDEIPDVRKVALEALTGVDDASAWRPLVLQRLSDENKDVRLTVIEIMGRFYDDEVIPHLLHALDDDDDWVKIRAIDALGEHAVTEGVPHLVGLLDNNNRFVVMKAIEGLGRIGGPEAFNALLEVTNSDEYELVSAAEEAINRIQEAQE